MKRIKLLVFVLLTGIFAHSGDTAFNSITSLKVKKESNRSSVTFKFEHPATYSIEPDVEGKKIKILFPQSGFDPSLAGRQVSDELVEAIYLKKVNKSNSLAEIVLRDLRTSVYHDLSRDGKFLTLYFKSRENLMAVNSGPEGEKNRLARQKADEAREIELANMEKNSGRDLYAKGMIEFQQNKFVESEVTLSEFLDIYPKSVYREKAMYVRGEALYRISKKDPTKINQAIDAFRVANFSYPLSEYIQRGRLRVADLYLDQNLDIEATAIYDSLIKADPKGKFVLSALKGKANVLLKRGEYDLAYNELEKILILFPGAKQVREARFRIAEAFYLKGKYETALKIFEDSHKKWPTYVRTNAESLDYFADTYFRLGKNEKALEFYIELVNLFPEAKQGKRAVNRMADIYLGKKDINSAVKILGMQARKRPDDPEGMHSRLRLAALGHSSQKIIGKGDSRVIEYPDYFEPVDTYNDIQANHSGTDQARAALFQKARLFFKNKRYVESIATLRKMMAEHPNSRFSRPVVELVKGNLYKLIGSYHDQGGYFSILSTYYDNYDPFLSDIENPAVMANIGDAYYETALYDRALEKYREAARLDKKGLIRERLRFSLGKAYYAKGDLQSAEDTLLSFAKRLKHSAYAPEAMHILGHAYYDMKKFDESIPAFVTAIEMDLNNSRNSKSAYYVGVMYKNKGEFAKAGKYFRMAIDSYRQDPRQKEEDMHIAESHYQLVETSYLAGIYGETVARANATVSLYPENSQNSWARYVKSDSQVKLSKDEEAVSSLKRIVEGEPASVYGKVASATVSNLDWRIKHKELFSH